jgi:hypothetical protein
MEVKLVFISQIAALYLQRILKKLN